MKIYNSLKDDDKVIQVKPKLFKRKSLIRYPLLVQNRRSLLKKFDENFIELGLWFTAPLSSQEINHELFSYKMGSCPNSEYISNRIINLPLHNNLIEKDIEKIIKLIKEN